MTCPISRFSAMSLVFLAFAVALGAMVSHFLESTLSSGLLDTWETAVQYQFWNCARINGFKSIRV